MGTYIAGVPEDEWHRLKNLPTKPLTPADIPTEEWKPGYEQYRLREDGAIIAEGMSIELGWVNSSGRVNWLG